jgi:hypothetical protein
MADMIIPVLKRLSSPDLERDRLPDDPAVCSIFCEAAIGPRDAAGGDLFSFTAVTAHALLNEEGARWGRAYLIVDRFSWPAVERAIGNLCMHCSRSTWDACAAELAKEMNWEFERYTP